MGDPDKQNIFSYIHFRNLWTAQIFSQVANNTLLFVLALNLYRITNSNTAVSILFLVYGLPALVFGPVAGTIVDKMENRSILLFCDITRALFTLCIMFFNTNLAVIYLLTFANSLVTQLYVPAEAPTLPYVVPKSLLVKANSLFAMTFYSSLAVGSLFAGPLLKLFNTEVIFMMLTVFFMIAAYMVRKIPSFLDYQYPISKLIRYSWKYIGYRIIENTKEGLQYMRNVPKLQEALTLLVGTQILITILGVLGPGFADRVLGIDVRDSSLFVTGPAVLGIILGAVWIGSKGFHIKPVILTQWGVQTAGCILIIIAVVVRISRMNIADDSTFHLLILPITLLLFFILGFANSLLDVPANSIIQQYSQGNMRGRMYGLLSASVGGIGILPVVAGGILADSIGTGKVILILGIIVSAYGFWRIKHTTIQ